MRRLSNREILSRGYHLLLTRPDPSRIFWLTLGITYRCNGQCSMCSIWKRYREHPDMIEQELRVDEYRKVLSTPFMDHLQGIGLTGGEPFLRDDIVQIAEAAIEVHPDSLLSIASNGLIPDRIEQATGEILKRDPHGLSISLSLDGNREVHNRIRGVGNAYERVLETAERLRHYEVNLGFNFTITPENWRSLADVEEVADHLGIPLLVNYAHTSTHYYGNQNISPVPEEHLDEIDVRLQGIAAKRLCHKSLSQRILDPYPYFLSRCTHHQRVNRQLVPCYSGTHSLYLDPQGQVFPCLIRDRPLGNIRDTDFTALWTSGRAREVRRSISAGECNCWVACEAVPSILRGLHSVSWNLKMLPRGESP